MRILLSLTYVKEKNLSRRLPGFPQTGLFNPASPVVRWNRRRGVKIEDVLERVPLFKGLPAEQINALARIATARTLKRGDIVFSEGQDADGFYITVTGRVKIFKVSPGGKEQVLHILDMLEPFGEVPVFTGGSFPANAQALEESKVLFLPRSGFMQLVKGDPSLATNLLALLSMRLRQFARLVEELSLKEVPARLASYLLYLSERDKGTNDLELDIPKVLLANVLGTIPETLSRILARMVHDHYIKVEGRRITILDRNGLEELGAGAEAASE